MTNNQLNRERLEYLKKYPESANKREAIELVSFMLAAMDSEPVAWVVGSDEIAEFNRGREGMVMRDCDDEELENLPLYRHPQSAPEMAAIVERLNSSGYEYEGGEVTPQKRTLHQKAHTKPCSQQHRRR